MEPQINELLERSHSTCDDKTNKAQLHNLKNKTDTLVLHKYDEQMLYNMKHMLLDCKRTVDAMFLKNVVANLS
jgi:hypothetical protein